MTRISNFWVICLAVTVSELSSVSGQSPLPALVPTRVVNAKSGQPANFSCESQGIPLSLCLWETIVPEGSTAAKTFLTITAASKAGQSVQPGYTYNGEGLEKGQCGITIESVRDKDNGNWQCTLISNTGTYRGTVNLGILRKPDAPGFNVQPTQLSDLVEDDPNRPGPSRAETTVTCYSSKGEPKPTFQWFIDDEPITDNLGPVNETTSGGNTFTFQELRNYRFTHKDNGKKLRCVLVHDALSDADKKEVTKDIVVQYRPRSADDGRETGRLPVRAELGEEKLISMNVSANPRPSNIQWTIDGKSLRENENSGNYEALPLKEVGPGVYETTLKIKEVEEEDLTKKISLRVENVYGVAEFAINISSSTAGSGGLNAGGILGIIIAVIAIIVLVAVIVVFARAKGLLCFKGDDGTASEKERMDGGSTGAGGAEEKPTLSSRLSAFYENLLAKKKDKSAPVDEEAGKDKETKEKDGAGEAGEGVAAASGDDKGKKPDDIVYAELDLARTGGTEQKPEVVVRGVDDKTEYAEIVGVAPQAKTVDETSPKKSPKGSPKN